MNEFNPAGVKTDTAIGVRALCAILEIAFDRTSEGCKLASYLVVPSGLQVDLQERIIIAPYKSRVTQDSKFRLFGPGFGYL